MTEILCLGICSQRSSFVTWDRTTGQMFHPINTWKDSRSAKIAKNYNNHFLNKVIRDFCNFLRFGDVIPIDNHRVKVFHDKFYVKIAQRRHISTFLPSISDSSILPDNTLLFHQHQNSSRI